LDQFKNPHPRFYASLKNTFKRKGGKLHIVYPLYPDVNTGEGKIDNHVTPGFIHMDSEIFGCGC